MLHGDKQSVAGLIDCKMMNEWPWMAILGQTRFSYHMFFKKKLRAFDFKGHHKKRMKIDAHNQPRKWKRMNVVSKSVRFVRIFRGFPREGALNGSGVLENGDVQTFPSKFPTKPTLLLYSPSSSFQWSQNAWPWMTSKRDSRCFVLALAPDASASTRLSCLA